MDFHLVHVDHLPNRPLVTSYPTRLGAERDLERNPGLLIASEAELLGATTVSAAVLVEMYNLLTTGPQVKKFSDRPTAAKRVWALLAKKASAGSAFTTEPSWDGKVRDGAVKSATEQYLHATDKFVRSEGLRKLKELNAPIPELATTTTEGDDMAKTKTTAPKKDKTPKPAKAAAGQKPKPVGELGTVREGTDRAKILALMDGTRTPAEISKAMGFPAKFSGDEKKATGYVNQHAYCAWRDSGVGYEFVDGKLLALYPGKKTLADVVKAPAPKPATKAAATKEKANKAGKAGVSKASGKEIQQSQEVMS